MSIDYPQDVPEPWRQHFEEKGITFTFRALERTTQGIAAGTIIRALTGQGTSTRRVARAVSDALGITVEKFHEVRSELAQSDVAADEPFRLPARANQLTQQERAVVLGVIDTILNARGVTTHESGLSDAALEPPSDVTPRT